jgi:hypothetical protein
MEQVTLIANIKSNLDNSESAFTTKLARPLNLPGQWRASIMDISYPHHWSKIHHDWTYAVLILCYKDIQRESDQREILAKNQPMGLDETSAISTSSNTGVNKSEIDLFNDVKEIRFLTQQTLYVLETKTIKENKNSDLPTIVDHIKNTITTMYRKEYPTETDCEDIVTYDPETKKVTFKNMRRSRYLIVAPATASIIAMLGDGARSTAMKMSSKRNIDVLVVYIVHFANLRSSYNITLPAVEEVNLRTLDNVFVYSDIIEQSLIGESQGNILGYFPIKSKFGETGYWCFNPPYDYKTIKNFVDTISIKLTTVNGELFPFNKGQIIIRLLFKRMI